MDVNVGGRGCPVISALVSDRAVWVRALPGTLLCLFEQEI